jgi:hypothetical protein
VIKIASSSKDTPIRCFLPFYLIHLPVFLNLPWPVRGLAWFEIFLFGEVRQRKGEKTVEEASRYHDTILATTSWFYGWLSEILLRPFWGTGEVIESTETSCSKSYVLDSAPVDSQAYLLAYTWN